MSKDYYTILGVAEDASEKDIRKAYHLLAMQYHPDRNTEKSAEARFKEINEANETLSDPTKRNMYDLSRDGGKSYTKPNTNSSSGFEHETIRGQKRKFDDELDELINEYRRKARQVIRLNLKEAYAGKIVKLGTETLRIPPGVRPGSKFFINGNIVEIEILQHPKFKRAEDDLLVDIDVDGIEAMLGTNALITHIDDTQLQFKIPAGIQHGQVIRLSGKGMSNPETDRRGDLLIRCNLKILKDLTEEQKAFLDTMLIRRCIII